MWSPDSKSPGFFLSLAIGLWVDANDLFHVFNILLKSVTIVCVFGLKYSNKIEGLHEKPQGFLLPFSTLPCLLSEILF